MKTILIPTDFSRSARYAADYATVFAKTIKAKIVLFHSYYYPVSTSEQPVMVITPEELERDSLKCLKRESARLKKNFGVTAECISQMGYAPDSILKNAKNASYIIMGMKGAGMLTEVFMGSTSTSVLHKSKIPVIIVPENFKFRKPHKLVFACEFEKGVNRRVLEKLKSLVRTFNASIYIVNITKELEHESKASLKERLKMDAQLKDIKHLFYFPIKSDVVEGVSEFVKNVDADMVVVVPHRYTMLERLFHKSISKKMAFHTKVPLLVLPDNHRSVPAYFI